MPNYPAQIDNTLSLPAATDGVTGVSASVVNRLRTAILAIETELGIKPSGVSTTVRNRLDGIEGLFNNSFVQLGGDIGGNSTNPKVVGLQGNPLSPTTPTLGQVLSWDGTKWLPVDPTTADTITVGLAGSGANYICDGTADELEINNAIIQANSLAKKTVVKLLPGTFYISAPINLLSNVSLEGSGAGSSKIVIATSFNESSLYAIGSSGTETTGTAINLASDGYFGGQTLSCASSAELGNVAVNKYLFLESNATWEISTNPPPPFTPASGRKRGEFVKVLALNSAGTNTIDIYGMTRDSYLVSDVARLYRMSLVENISIRNIEIYQQAPAQTRVANTCPMISLQKTLNATIENVRIHDSDGPAITIYQCVAVRINKCYIHDLANNTSAGYYGYGILIGGASENIIVSNCNIDRLRHGIDAGPSVGISSPTSNYGVPRGVSIVNNIVTRATNAAYSTHNESENWSFVGNVASNSLSYGMYMRGRGCSLIGNTIEWCGGGIGIGDPTYNSSGGSGSGTNVTGNTIRHIKGQTSILASYVALGITSSTYALGEGIVCGLTDNSVIADNVISNCDRAGIRLRVYAINNVFRNNTILNCNLRNASGSSSEAIVFDSDFSLSNASITFSGGTCTLTATGAGFHAAFAGRKITITGAATPGNNGTFTIISVTSTTSVTYTNASGATDANNGSISYWLEGSTDNTFEGNFAANTPASLYDRDTTGHMKYLVRDYGTNGNIRNIFKNNTGFKMETGLMLVNSNSFQAGNSNTEGVPLKVLTTAPDDSNFLSAPQPGTLTFNSTNNATYIRTTTTNVWKRIDFGTSNQWDSTATSISLNQADTAVNSATGQNLTIRAQNATGTTSNGGSLLLAPGSGTTSNGTIRFTDPAGNNAVGITPAPTGNTSFNFSGGVTAINFQQTATSIANGATFQISAQNASSTFNGGNIGLSGGNGTGTGNGGSINISTGTGVSPGSINFRTGGTTFFTFLTPNPTGAVSGNFVNTITGVTLIHATTASATGGNFTVQAQNAATTGGVLNLTSGTGSVAANAGSVLLQTGGVSKLTIAPTLTTSANQIAIGSTTASTGDIRLPNTSTVKARNAANTNDLTVFQTTGTDLLEIGTDSAYTAANQVSRIDMYSNPSGTIYLGNGSTTRLGLSSLGVMIYSLGDPLTFGYTGAATSGQIRLPQASNGMMFRNVAGTADIAGVSALADNLYIGSDGSGASRPTNTAVVAQNGVQLVIASTVLLNTNATYGVASAQNTSLGSTTPSYGGGSLVTFISDASVVPSSNPLAGAILYSIAGRLKYRGSDGYTSSLDTADATINGYRLTLTTATPLPITDVTGASTLYLTPYTSGYISLWDGNGWRINTTGAQVQLSLTGMSAGFNHDVFAYIGVANQLTIELGAAWTSDTVRSVALARQNGVLVKSGDPTRRYLGTIRAVTATTTQDAIFSRWVWNYYNQVPRRLYVEDTSSTWTVTTTANVWQRFHSLSSNKVDFVCGAPVSVQALTTITQSGTPAGTGVAVWSGIGIDSTTVNSAKCWAFLTQSTLTPQWNPAGSDYSGVIDIGYHALNWLESSNPGGCTAYGTVGANQSHMTVSLPC